MKSVVGLVLGLVGAIANICLSGLMFFLYFGVSFGRSALIENDLSETMIAFSNRLSFWLLFLAIWLLILGIVAIVSAFIVSLKQPWTKIVVRVAGSWVAAMGMLMFGWLMRGQG